MTEQPTEPVEPEEQPSSSPVADAKGEPPDEPTRQQRRDHHVRQQLREVEQERDTLRSRLDARDRAQVEAMAKAVLGEAGAKLFAVPDLGDLRDEDGNLDADAVAELLAPVKAALEEGKVQHHGDMGAQEVGSGHNTCDVGPTPATAVIWSHQARSPEREAGRRSSGTPSERITPRDARRASHASHHRRPVLHRDRQLTHR